MIFGGDMSRFKISLILVSIDSFSAMLGWLSIFEVESWSRTVMFIAIALVNFTGFWRLLKGDKAGKADSPEEDE